MDVSNLKKTFDFKQSEDAMLMQYLSPYLLIAMGHVALWCQANNLPFVVTRTVDDKIPNVSVSDTHGQGRAFDMSVKGWYADQIERFQREMNNSPTGIQYGAKSAKDGVIRLVVHESQVIENGNTVKSEHCHVQTRAVFINN
jgi:hypothetical protein